MKNLFTLWACCFQTVFNILRAGIFKKGNFMLGIIVLASVFGNRLSAQYTQASVAYNWTTPTGTIISSSSCDDCTYGPFPIGFTFNYFGTNYTQFYVSSNGLLTFDAANASYSNTCFPTSLGTSAIGAYWDDLYYDYSCSPTYFYYNSTGGVLTVSWVSFTTVAAGGTTCSNYVSAQVQLYQTSNVVQVNVQSAYNNSSSTIGIQNSAGTVGYNAVCNGGITNGSSWTWTPSATYTCSVVTNGTTLTPTCTAQSVNLGPGESDQMAVTNGLSYTLSYSGPGSCADGSASQFCVNGTTYSSPQTLTATSGSNWVIGQPETSSSWVGGSGCSAVLTYRLANSSPTVTVTPSSATGACTSQALSATGSGGNGTLSYTWSNGSTSATPTVTSSGTYTVTVKDQGNCSVAGSTGAITIYSAPTASLSGGSSPVCYNAIPATFTTTAGGGNGSYTYLWYKNGTSTGTTTSTYSPGALTSTSTIYCAVTSGSCGTTNTSSYTVTVDGALSASQSGGTTPVCYNTAPGTFTATGSGGTGSYTYLWYLNGAATSTTSSTYAPGNLTATSSIYCAVTSGSCGTVNTTASTIAVDGSLSASQSGGTTPVCYNTAPGTFTATGSGGTGSYTYLWYKNAVSTGITTSTYAPGNLTSTSTIYCAVTSGSCGTANTTASTITVYGNLTASQSGGTTPICNNTSPGTFTATASGGNGSYTYQWYNGSGSVSGATASTYTAPALTANNSYYCSVTSGGSCGSTVTGTTSISVDAAVSASISGGTTTICNNTSPGTFTATGSGGNGSYTYQWYNSSGAISGATASTYTAPALTAGNAYHCSVTSGGSCGSAVTGTTTITVDAALAAAISGGSSPICHNTSPGTYTATASGGAGSYTYKWYNNEGLITGATASTYNPGFMSNSDAFYCSVTDASCGSVSTSSSGVTVTGHTTESISGGTSPICYGTSPGTMTAAGGEGSGPFTYQWYLNGNAISGVTTSTYNPGNITATSSYYCIITDAHCGAATTNTVPITVYSNIAASTSGGSSPLCYGTAPGTFTATGSGGTGSYTYLWYLNNSSTGLTTSTYTPGNLTATSTVYCAVTSSSGCGTANTTPYTVTVDANFTANQSGGTSPICYNTAPGTFTATGSGGTGSYTYLWYKNATSTGITTSTYAPGSLTSTSTIYCAVTSGSCGTLNTTASTITVYGNLSASQSGGASPICYNVDPGVLTASGSGGTGSYTYSWYLNGSATGITTSTYDPGVLSATSTIYCAVTSGSCGTINATSTTITVYGNLTASQTGGTSPICYNNAPGTFTATGSGGTGSYTYLWYKNAVSTGITTSTYAPGNLTATSTIYCAVASGTCGTANTGNSTITVYGNLAASISGGTTPACYNSDPGVFTATGSGGTGSYTYQWYNSSGSISGSTSSTYDPGTLTASNTYSCSVTSGSCGTVSAGTSAVTVEPAVSSYGTLAASGGLTQTVCSNVAPNNGNPFTVSGAAGNSGTFTYQWYYQNGLVAAPSGSSTSGWTACSGVGTGYNTASFTPGGTPANITYACFVTPAAPVCGTGQWATNDAQVTVLSSGPTESSSGGANVCIGGGVTLSSALSVVIPATYQWYSSTNIGFTSPTTITGATTTTYAPPTSASGTLYYEIIATFSGSGCSPATSPAQAVVVYTAPTAAISGGNSPVCYNTSPGVFTVTPTGGSGSFTYQWYNSGGSVSGATNSTYNPGNLTASNSYYASITDVAGCGTAGTSTTSITVDANLSAAISGGTTPICYNQSPGTYTATASGGTGTYTYQWYNGGGSISGATASTYTAPNLTASNSYYCAITSGTCGTVNTAIKNVTVHANLTATATGGTTPICYNTAPGTISVVASGGTGTYTYQWYNASGAITGATASTYAPGALTASNGYYCSVTSGTCGTVSSNTRSITVDASLTASISGGTTTICYNTDPGTMTATGTGGTGTYTYQWYNGSGSISGATASTYDPGTLTASNSYTCSVTSGTCGTVSSNTISITVDANLTASISGGTTPVCYNTDPGTFTASGSGGTGTYTYQWYNGGGAISGATASTYDPGSLTVSNSYHCSVTSGGCGTVSTSTTGITVNANLTASISGGTSPLCYNTAPGTFTATASGGTGSYTYQWYNSSGLVGGATASTYAPGNITAGNTYSCSVTSGSCGTAGSNAISIAVDANLTASISGGTSPICYNTAPGTFTATATGGTGTYTYQWYNGAGAVSGATNNTYAPGNITTGDTYTCSITSGSCGTATSNTISITVDGNLTAVISGGTSPLCYNTAPGTFTVTAGGGTGSYTYQWYNAGGLVSGATANTYAPGNLTSSNSYHCSVTSGGCGSVSTSTTGITVNATLTASISGGTSPICYNSAPGTFTGTGSGGTGSYTYQWYNGAGLISGATASTYAPGALTASNTYTCSVTSGSCGTAGSNTISITTDANLTAAISGGTSPVCYNSAPGMFTTTGSGGTGSYTYQWYNASGSISGATGSTYAPGNLTANNAYHCSVTSGSCGSASTSTTSIVVDATLTATISGGTTTVCYNSAPGTFTATGNGGTGSYTYQWFNGAGSISGATASTYAPGNLTVSNSYYCVVTSGSCGTANTSTTGVTVETALSASISGGSTPVCYNSAPGTFTAVGTGGTGSYTYQWYNGGSSISGATASTYAPGNITASTTYQCSVTSGSCGTAGSNAIAITAYANLVAGTVGSDQGICSGSTPAAFTSTTLPTGGTGSYTYQWQISTDNSTWTNVSGTGTTYSPGATTVTTYFRRQETSGSCGTVNSNEITITVSSGFATINPTVSSNPVCVTASGGGTNIQIANSVSGVNYQLQTSTGANVGSPVAGTGNTINLPTGNITANTTYQVEQISIAYGCSATTAANINVVAVNPDIALGTQIPGQHYTFGTLASPALPSGFSTPANTNSIHFGLATGHPASSNSYSYINSAGGTSSASTGAYIQTPTGASATTPVVELVSGTINATGYTNISVQWAAQKSAGYTGTVSLYYSVDGGTSWTAVSFTDVQANVTGTPWSLVNNTVQVKLPTGADNQANLKIKWAANPSTGSDYYSMNDIGIYGLGKILNCGANNISVPYLNTSCTASLYSLNADATNPWPGFSYVSGTAFSGSAISIAVPSTTASGTYNLDMKVDDGAGNYSNAISFPVTQDLLLTATPAIDNCSCSYTTSGGIGAAYGNIVTVYATGGSGTGYYFSSAGVVDTLLTTYDRSGNPTSGAATQIGNAVKGIFWSKADGLSHTYKISDGYCTTTTTRVTQGSLPTDIPFSSATGQPTAITAGQGGGNGISGSYNNSGLGDPNISNVNGKALTCHHTSDFANNWVVYHINNVDSTGAPLAGDSTNNKAVVEINSNGVNLDSVEVSVYRDANLPAITNNLSAIACSGYTQYAMERHFMIKSNKSTGANSFSNGVGVRLYFTDAEFQDLKYWTMHVAQNASGESASCAYGDTVTNLNSIYVTKYTGANEDGDYSNNAPSGLYRLFGKSASNPGNGPLSAIDGGGSFLATGGNTNLHYVQMNVKEFSEFWLGGSQSIEALPVQMVYLEAEAMNNDSIQVRWATETEINNKEFAVERSTDGETWTVINTMPGHNNSLMQVDYAYNDLSVEPGVTYYYRLKQIDNNGNYQYTGIVQAKINGGGTFTVMNFVPNPTLGNTQLTVVTTKTQQVTVEFFDMLGQKVMSLEQGLNAGSNRIDFDLHHLAAGTYSAVVTSESLVYTKKIVIAR